jgi:hypothetical protein
MDCSLISLSRRFKEKRAVIARVNELMIGLNEA